MLENRFKGFCKIVLLYFAACVAIFLLAEASVRLIGVTDFPIYIRSDSIKYYLKPNQHGAFLNVNHWYVNAQGFDNNSSFLSSHPDCMLVGDSVVYGGNPVDYKDRVGTVAANIWKHRIWVASAGGWSLLNELAFLQMHLAQVQTMQTVVFVLNNGDFGAAAPWTGNLAYPTYHPIFASYYIARRYVLPRLLPSLFSHPSELPQVNDSSQLMYDTKIDPDLVKFLHEYSGNIVIVLYPDRENRENGRLWDANTAGIRRFVHSHSGRIKLVDFKKDPAWVLSMYRDGIHPNNRGARILAKVVAQACRGKE